MEFLDHLALGFSVALSFDNLAYCFLGVLLGTVIGVLPGVGPLVTIAVLLPLTYGLPPEGSLIMLAGIYYGAAYGGSTTAILLNVPGESSSVVSCMDGYQMARQGRAGAALAIAAIGSFAAGCFGTVLIAVLAIPFSKIALIFWAPEYFSLMLLALICTSALARGSVLKSIGMAFVGLLIGMVGTDVASGQQRFTFGIPALEEGVDFVVVAMGLFAFAEVINNLGKPEDRSVLTAKIGRLLPNMAEWAAAWKAIARGTLVGSGLGLLPGAGQTISSFISYLVEKKVSRDPSRFGNGAVEGLAGPESANNAAAQTSFIPTLTLGIPGSATMALVLGALMVQGISPGPQLLTERPTLFWGLIASMWIGNLLLVVLNLPLVGIWVKLLKMPYRWLFSAIMVFSCVGIYTVSNNPLDVVFAAGFGVMGYLFTKLDCEPPPLILGFVLGPMMEENFRRALQLSRGDPTVFISRPISAAFMILAVIVLFSMLIPFIRHKKEEAVVEE